MDSIWINDSNFANSRPNIDRKITPRLNNKLNKHLNLNTIVIFKPPKILTEAGYSDGSALIKRVVGLPGDKIEVTNGNYIEMKKK